VTDRPLPLYVPDLAPGAAARIDRDGRVHCIECGRSLALRDADIVGLGYRCTPCGIAGDHVHDLRPSEQVEAERRRPAIRGRYALVAFVVLVAILAVMWHYQWDVGAGRLRGGDLFVDLFVAACGCLGIAIIYRKKPMI